MIAIRPLIMGILNMTPDSFSDGGAHPDLDAAVAHAAAMIADGADIIDVGGESTRPGAVRVDADVEMQRVLPVIGELVSMGARVSIDTMNARTADAAASRGVDMINDVSAGAADPDMARVAAANALTFIAMHSRGASDAPADYADIVADVTRDLSASVRMLTARGVSPARIVLDPGLGFAKTAEQSWRLVGAIDKLRTLGHPILVGASRKRFLATVMPAHASVSDRDAPTAIITALAADSGAWAVRVHDVAGSKLALDVWSAARGSGAAVGAPSGARPGGTSTGAPS